MLSICAAGGITARSGNSSGGTGWRTASCTTWGTPRSGRLATPLRTQRCSNPTAHVRARAAAVLSARASALLRRLDSALKCCSCLAPLSADAPAYELPKREESSERAGRPGGSQQQTSSLKIALVRPTAHRRHRHRHHQLLRRLRLSFAFATMSLNAARCRLA